MSKIKYFLIAIMAIFLASCKGGLAPIKPGSTSLEGDLATYYEVVDKEYTFAEDGDITIDFKKSKRRTACSLALFYEVRLRLWHNLLPTQV